MSEAIWSEAFESDVRSGFIKKAVAARGDYSPHLVVNGQGRTVEHSLVESLRRSESFVFSVAFVTPSAIAQLKQHFVEFRGSGIIVTSDFLMFNRPEVFRELLKLQEVTGIKVLRHRSPAFHPKGYVFRKQDYITAMVGSANLTSQALSRNYEWNLKISAASESALAIDLEEAVSQQIAESQAITEEWVEQYASSYVIPIRPPDQVLPPDRKVGEGIKPNEMQREALNSLREARLQGARRAVIISATGTGKTILSALDVQAVDPFRFLFVVHREQILDRTISEFMRVLGGEPKDFGKLTGSSKNFDSKYIFATVQTLAQEQILGQFAPNTFDYIVVDEAHRAAADTYRRFLEHFQPDFLLGMTATPERTDGFNVFELFDYNVPYEIRLNRALEAEMLAPFHYYGVTDIEFDDGSTTTDATELRRLVSTERVDHILRALNTYGQAGTDPKGLIFCSRKEEAYELAFELNNRTLKGRKLRTVALTGEDPVSGRESTVRDLENGDLDYILTVDVFNEGIDIPSINQVIMLRQTQSPIVFVQQLGRGLRLSEGKEYLVVIDFIGNYNNNFMIPIALFGDDSLNRESLRERLNETVEAGSLPGLSSVSFDEISRDRILLSVNQTRLDSLANLKSALVSMRNRVGKPPALYDFYRFESVDPVLLATKLNHYPELVAKLLGQKHGFSETQSRALELLSHEVLSSKRPHELALLEALLEKKKLRVDDLPDLFRSRGLLVTASIVSTVLDTFSLDGYAESAQKRYGFGLLVLTDGWIELIPDFVESLSASATFSDAVYDLIRTGTSLLKARYQTDSLFTPGMQYSRQDASHLLGWPRKFSSTIYGVKTDTTLGVCAIFVTLEKSDDVSASTAYKDQLLDLSTMRWFTKSNRRLSSKDVAPIVNNQVDLHVFVKKDDADGTNHYYLGQAISSEATETTMKGVNGESLPVVTMLLEFHKPISQGLFDYFAPSSLV